MGISGELGVEVTLEMSKSGGGWIRSMKVSVKVELGLVAGAPSTTTSGSLSETSENFLLDSSSSFSSTCTRFTSSWFSLMRSWITALSEEKRGLYGSDNLWGIFILLIMVGIELLRKDIVGDEPSLRGFARGDKVFGAGMALLTSLSLVADWDLLDTLALLFLFLSLFLDFTDTWD